MTEDEEKPPFTREELAKVLGVDEKELVKLKLDDPEVILKEYFKLMTRALSVEGVHIIYKRGTASDEEVTLTAMLQGIHEVSEFVKTVRLVLEDLDEREGSSGS